MKLQDLTWQGQKALLAIADSDAGITTTELKDKTGLRGEENISGKLHNQFENMRDMDLIESEPLPQSRWDKPGIPPNRHILTEHGERILFEEGIYQELESRFKRKNSGGSIQSDLRMLAADVRRVEHQLDAVGMMETENKCYAEDLDDAQVIELQSRIDTLQGTIGGLQSRMKRLSEAVEQIPESELGKSSSDIEDLQDEVKQVREGLDQVRSDLDEFEQLQSNVEHISNIGENANGVMSYTEMMQLVLMLLQLFEERTSIDMSQVTAPKAGQLENVSLTLIAKYLGDFE